MREGQRAPAKFVRKSAETFPVNCLGLLGPANKNERNAGPSPTAAELAHDGGGDYSVTLEELRICSQNTEKTSSPKNITCFCTSRRTLQQET